MTRDTRTQLVASIVLVLCMAGSAALAVALTGISGRARLAYTDRAEEGQPWEVSAGIAMGAFRGIFVNFLWIRANEMKEEGKFFEAIQLADAITRLQPRFPRVWVFHAWNLAYNISVSTQTREERWQWVNSGINLLRTRAVAANPDDMLIHKELGWIFLHKIGGFTDDANPYYKRMFAREWTLLLGPPPKRSPEDRDRNKAISRHVAWLAPLRDAPDSIPDLIARVPAVETLRNRLKEAGVATDTELLARFEGWRAVRASGYWKAFEANAGDKDRAIGAIVDDPEMAEAWTALLAYVRRQVLTQQYGMDVERMIRYTEKFGPIDWRHHAAHAVYWAQKGVEGGLKRVQEQNRQDYDFTNTDRIVAQGIQDLFRTGDLYFDFAASMVQGRYVMWQGVPNPHFVESYKLVIDDMRARSPFDDPTMRGTTALSSGYENFIKDAVTFFYARGDMVNAEKWASELINYRYINMNSVDKRELLAEGLDVFVFTQLKDDLTRPAIAIQQVAAGLQQAFVGGLLEGDQDRFLKGVDYAKKVHRIYFEAQDRFTVVDPTQSRMTQMPREFDILAGEQFAGFLSRLSLDDAEAAYDRAPDDLRAFAYDALMMRFGEEIAMLAAAEGEKGRTFDQRFPPPATLAEVRERIRRVLEQRQAPEVSVEKQ